MSGAEGVTYDTLRRSPRIAEDRALRRPRVKASSIIPARGKYEKPPSPHSLTHSPSQSTSYLPPTRPHYLTRSLPQALDGWVDWLVGCPSVGPSVGLWVDLPLAFFPSACSVNQRQSPSILGAFHPFHKSNPSIPELASILSHDHRRVLIDGVRPGSGSVLDRLDPVRPPGVGVACSF
ncbi:hypothetical protein TCAL_16569 [Tigriopus californicus]|uniref:Uncharacterized protein n=1 Tax=Tigriopus californicus TaxID=6832 RepID=A0A553NE17_TIGCA|nr:hypothetical protein TCAL_16569 [Tigriopus californicus]